MASSTATILFLNLPVKTFVGIDLLSFNSSPKFHGIANIPPGLHFIYTGTDASLAIRHGRWLNVQPSTTISQTYVLKWITEDENLALLHADSEAADNAAASIPSLQNRGLVNYNALTDASADAQSKQNSETNNSSEAEKTDWPLLTSYLSTSVLSRILTKSWTISSISSAPNDTESIPGLTALESSTVLDDSNLNVVPINLKQTWPDDAMGRDRTDKARDRSWYLGHLIDQMNATGNSRQTGARHLLGELQFCFLMVLTLANYSCLEQWKRILSILLTSQKALGEIDMYFVEGLKLLQLQLRHAEDVEGGLFELREEGGSAWLRQLIARFKRNVEDELGEGKTKIGDELIKFEEFMQERYAWQSEKDLLKRGMVELEDGERIEVSMDGLDEEEESGEYAPMVVETT